MPMTETQAVPPGRTRASTVPTWVSSPVAVQLSSGSAVSVSIELHRPDQGSVHVTSTFNDGDAGSSSGFCGDGVVNTAAGEQCDDGNVINGDGCSSQCQLETPRGDGGVSDGSVSDGGSSTLPTGCTAPIAFSGGQTGNFNTTGAVCYRTTSAIGGWGCANFDGRTLKVDNVTVTCGGALPARWSDGYYYFVVSGGTYSYASIYYW